MKITGILGGNWGLKLLALALAIVIYYTIKNEPAHGGRLENRISHDEPLLSVPILNNF